jgi:hypothetical protein
MLPIHRSASRTASRTTLAIFASAAMLGLASIPALAKGPILEASFDQPISFQSPAGAELLVALTVTVDEAFEGHSAAGAPVWLRLIGPTGDTTEAAGSIGKGAGRYEMRILVPEGGPRRLEVYLPGGPGESDIQLWLMNDPFTFRPIGEGTAQLAPPLAPMAPVATKAAAPPPVTVPAAGPVATPAPEPARGNLTIALLALAGGALAGVALVGMRRSGRPGAGQPVAAAMDAPTRAPGA